jgi:hypothetical protein
VLGVLLLAGALTIALASSGDDAGNGSDSNPAADESPARPGPGRRVELQSTGAGSGAGTAQLLAGGDRVAVRVTGLPDPGDSRYAVWLYDSLLNARQIASSDRGAFSVYARLPPRASRYELLDVSREPDDGNPRHSGQSVLRVPVRELTAPAG